MKYLIGTMKVNHYFTKINLIIEAINFLTKVIFTYQDYFNLNFRNFKKYLIGEIQITVNLKLTFKLNYLNFQKLKQDFKSVVFVIEDFINLFIVFNQDPIN